MILQKTLSVNVNISIAMSNLKKSEDIANKKPSINNRLRKKQQILNLPPNTF